MSHTVGKKGFTLVELMLVTVIIGVLAGAVVLVFTGNATEAKNRRAMADIKMYQTAIDLYALDNNDQNPKSLKALVGGKKNYVRKVVNDPWGNPYIFVIPGKKNPKSYDLSSMGADGQQGTADDIAEWNETVE